MPSLKEGRLNVDIAGSISTFEDMMKEFRLKKDFYKIIFRGKGLEFEAYRDFTPDDDAQDIDWKVSSRAQKLLVKQYKEERDLKIMFLIDVGNNMVFGSTNKLKCEYMTEMVAAFAKIVMDANDRVGFIFFSDDVKQYSECKGGEKHFELFVDLLSEAKNYGGITDLDKALDYAMRYLDKSINSVILVSDFLRVTYETEKRLRTISSKFETIVIRVRDMLDITLPDLDKEIIIENPLTHEQMIINPRVAKRVYEAYAYEQSKFVEEIFKKSEVDYLDLTTDKSFAPPLMMFLKERVDKKF